jgi:hypothetical protein
MACERKLQIVLADGLYQTTVVSVIAHIPG